jgi:hypothetical protein
MTFPGHRLAETAVRSRTFPKGDRPVPRLPLPSAAEAWDAPLWQRSAARSGFACELRGCSADLNASHRTLIRSSSDTSRRLGDAVALAALARCPDRSGSCPERGPWPASFLRPDGTAASTAVSTQAWQAGWPQTEVVRKANGLRAESRRLCASTGAPELSGPQAVTSNRDGHRARSGPWPGRGSGACRAPGRVACRPSYGRYGRAYGRYRRGPDPLACRTSLRRRRPTRAGHHHSLPATPRRPHSSGNAGCCSPTASRMASARYCPPGCGRTRNGHRPGSPPAPAFASSQLDGSACAAALCPDEARSARSSAAVAVIARFLSRDHREALPFTG